MIISQLLFKGDFEKREIILETDRVRWGAVCKFGGGQDAAHLASLYLFSTSLKKVRIIVLESIFTIMTS